MNFSSDDKSVVLSSRSVQNLVGYSNIRSKTELNLNTWSNRQLHNVKLQTFAANLLASFDHKNVNKQNGDASSQLHDRGVCRNCDEETTHK